MRRSIRPLGVILAMAAVGAVLFFWTRGKAPETDNRASTVPPPSVQGEGGASNMTRRSQPEFSSAAPARPSVKAELVAEVCAGMKDEAKALIDQSLDTVAFLEIEKRRFTNRNAIAFLGGVQRKIFKEDYAYTAYATKSGDCDQGNNLFTNLIAPRLQALSPVEIEAGFIE